MSLTITAKFSFRISPGKERSFAISYNEIELDLFLLKIFKTAAWILFTIKVIGFLQGFFPLVNLKRLVSISTVEKVWDNLKHLLLFPSEEDLKNFVKESNFAIKFSGRIKSFKGNWGHLSPSRTLN